MSNKKISFIAAAVLFVIVLGAGYVGYTQYVIPDQVAKSTNKNVDVLNTNNQAGKNILDEVTLSVQALESGDSKRLDDALGKLERKQGELDQLSRDTVAAQDRLDRGNNTDTQKVHDTAKKSLEKRAKTYQSLGEFTKFVVCLSKNVQDQTAPFEAVQSILVKAGADGSDAAATAAAARQAATEVDKTEKAVAELKLCYVGGFQSQYTSELDDDVQQDIKLCSNFSSGLRQLADGIEQNNENSVKTGNQKIQAAAAQKQVLLDGDSFKKTITDASGKITKVSYELKEQEDELDKVFEKVRQKYNLDPVK